MANLYHSRAEPVDHAIGPDDDLTELQIVALGNHTSRFRKAGQPLHALDDSLHHQGGIAGRIGSDIVSKLSRSRSDWDDQMSLVTGQGAA